MTITMRDESFSSPTTRSSYLRSSPLSSSSSGILTKNIPNRSDPPPTKVGEEEERVEDSRLLRRQSVGNKKHSNHEDTRRLINVHCSHDSSSAALLVEPCPFSDRYGSCDYLDQVVANSSSQGSGSGSGSGSGTDEQKNLVEMVIPFDYELYYYTQQEQQQQQQPPLDFVQGFLLHTLAQTWDLPDCSLLNGKGGNGRNLQDALNATFSTSSSISSADGIVVGISTDFSDSIDMDAGGVAAACQAPVEGSIEDSSECRRILGQLTILVDTTTSASAADDAGADARNDEELAITSYALKEVRSIMIDDQLVIATPAGSITRVVFMGQAAASSATTTTPTASPTASPTGTTANSPLSREILVPQTASSGTGLSGLSIAFMGIILFLLLALSGVLCLLWQKGRGRNNNISKRKGTHKKGPQGLYVPDESSCYDQGTPSTPSPQKSSLFDEDDYGHHDADGGGEDGDDELLDTTFPDLNLSGTSSSEELMMMATVVHENKHSDATRTPQHQEQDKRGPTAAAAAAAEEMAIDRAGFPVKINNINNNTNKTSRAKTRSVVPPQVVQVSPSQDSHDLSTMDDSNDDRCWLNPYTTDHDPTKDLPSSAVSTPTRQLNFLSEPPGHEQAGSLFFGDDDDEESSKNHPNRQEDPEGGSTAENHNNLDTSMDEEEEGSNVVDTSFAAAVTPSSSSNNNNNDDYYNNKANRSKMELDYYAAIQNSSTSRTTTANKSKIEERLEAAAAAVAAHHQTRNGEQ